VDGVTVASSADDRGLRHTLNSKGGAAGKRFSDRQPLQPVKPLFPWVRRTFEKPRVAMHKGWVVISLVQVSDMIHTLLIYTLWSVFSAVTRPNGNPALFA